MPGPYFASTYLPQTIDQTFEVIPFVRNKLPGFSSGIVDFPWDYNWSSGNPIVTSGNYFAFAPAVLEKFVEATVERVAALNWFNPSSGIDLYGVSRYFLPSSGNQVLNITQGYTNDYGWNTAFIQKIVYDIAKYYASCSGSYDSLIYPFGFASGDYNTLGFPYYTFGPAPSGMDYVYQDYSFKPERYIGYPSGLYLQQDGTIWKGNPASGNPLWPPPSGFTRIYPREVYDLRQSGYIVGQNARFIALINHDFARVGLPEGLSGINYNGIFTPSVYTTPIDQRTFSNQIVKYMGLGSGWVTWDESRFGPKPINPDLIMNFGLIQYGDYMGPWILNDLQTAINRLNRICIMRNPHDGNQLNVYSNSLYANSVWRSSGTKNDKAIYIPFADSTNLNPSADVWAIFADSTNINTAWHNAIHSAGYSGVDFLQNPCIGGLDYENSSSILSTGTFTDTFYTKNFTVGPSGHYDFPTGYPGYFDTGSTLDFYDTIIDTEILAASGSWDSYQNGTWPFFDPPPDSGPSGIPATVTFYWRGGENLTTEEPFTRGALPAYVNAENIRPARGIAYFLTASDIVNFDGVGILCRSSYLSSSGFLPQRKGFLSAYVYTEMLGQAISGTYPTSIYPLVTGGATVDGYSIYRYGKYNSLGTNLKWRQWTSLASGIVGSGDVFNTPVIGDYSNPPSINILDDFPSGNNLFHKNFVHDSEGYEVTNWAFVIDYAISGGFKYQGPIRDITYPSLSGLFGS